jgi:copper chaperone CopZ
VELAEYTLKIDGMHCGSCMRRVSHALAATPGIVVNEVRIGAARVSSDENPPPLGLAIAAIAKAGYTAYLDSSTVDAASSQTFPPLKTPSPKS